jgi:hypothetical protein
VSEAEFFILVREFTIFYCFASVGPLKSEKKVKNIMGPLRQKQEKIVKSLTRIKNCASPYAAAYVCAYERWKKREKSEKKTETKKRGTMLPLFLLPLACLANRRLACRMILSFSLLCEPSPFV